MNSQLLSKPEFKIADFYAFPDDVSPEAFESATNLLENGIDGMKDLGFLAGIKQLLSHDLNLNEGNLESIITAAKNAGFEVEVTPIAMK